MSRAHGSGGRVSAILLTAGLLAAGCNALGPRFHLAPDAPKSSDFRRVALLPMNFDRSPIASIAPGTELMGERIRLHLEAKGYEVVAPKMSTTLALWKECIEHVGGIAGDSDKEIDPERYAQARSELVRRTLAAYPADGAVSATIILREARYAGDKLGWDGVMRTPRIDVRESNRAVLQLRGRDVGISLRTSVFDREGRNIFERYVGLEPLREYRVQEGRMRATERKDLFRDEAIIEEGITLSFQPWLPDETE